ncbi:MAG: hypothetical protein L0K41_08425 [Yaniella sp.]|uniref:hypothetical protein n=1 Tax=Yaniella sp. TaxID=2773929 RepID=UPI002648FFCE|nr:hypothetical protein [Yaniella sp.]MDN5731648.1 hypothetical protein [Yaniella sp.]MDN5817411.1 hypothetical protein [Yaniella sp.]MDN5912430.1 hypothetical protein [Yaniella sp.]MDN6149082.1 hypothetical protein [Yaniella sp.]MDN6173254.1 hypothetical protein [Yaniella sp.]
MDSRDTQDLPGEMDIVTTRPSAESVKAQTWTTLRREAIEPMFDCGPVKQRV